MGLLDRKYKEIFTLISILHFVILSSCHVTYKVRNNQQSLQDIMAFPCGTVNMELEGRGNSKFIFRQKFMLDRPMIYFPDSVRVLYNNLIVGPLGFKSDASFSKNIKLSPGNHKMELVFEIHDGVFDGDTIKIIAKSFIECQESRHSLDALIYTFRNPVIIQGVNSP